MLNKTTLALLVAGLLASSASFAQGTRGGQDTGFYAGLHFGQSGAECAAAAGISCDDSDTAWKILGGYQFTRNLAVEAGYVNLGEITITGGGSRLVVETTGWDLVGVGSFPINNQFSVYGKLGFHSSDTEIGSAKDDGIDLTFGIGARYDFSRNLGVRAEWQRYGSVAAPAATSGVLVVQAQEFDIDVVSVGLVWKF